MTTDGGGWTLLVSSHTNTWSESNVRLRSEKQPSITEDYSILKYGDKIKNYYLIAALNFEYRLEANRRGEKAFFLMNQLPDEGRRVFKFLFRDILLYII